ncbi:hypothetical protein JHK87_041032 [Glycine soja]|nr:hypothetical protein JHK87_041032 [Glycine soja]
MATATEGVEYESDPEEATRSLAMRRRREASDDEETDADADRRDATSDRRITHSVDSDGEGGVADYDDEEDLEEEEEAVEEEEEEVEEEDLEEEERSEHEYEGGANGTVVKDSDDADVKALLEESGNGNEEEKKENEPFAVPTAGAFYMHDDRFRDNAGARHRRMRGGRRLWESKDDRKWGHDKFEEITLQERHYKEGRRPSKGNFRGRGGKTRGVDRSGGYVRGNRKGYDNRGNQTQAPKSIVRGRGPRRYEPTSKNNDSASQVQNKQSGKQPEKTSHASSGKTFAPVSNSEPDPVPAKKQVFASSLNYASPPFYPSSSSNKDLSVAPKGDVQTCGTGRNVRSGVVNDGFLVQQNSALLRGKNVVDHVSMEKLYIDGPGAPSAGKAFNNMHIPPPGSSGVNASQSAHPRGHGRGGAVPVQMNYQPVTSHNQVSKIDPTQLQAIQRTAPGQTSPSLQTPAPQVGNRPGSGSQASSPPKTSNTISSLDSGEIDAASDPSKLKGALVGKGRGAPQGSSGRGSFVYGGAMGTAGNISGSHGDQNFPTFLPVMQFGGQHPGGIGVPAVGMAFPGYVAQPQLGLGNSEMTWLPVLTGAAGALGATYCPPYLTVDGYHARQSGQTSATSTSSKENNVNKANNEWKPPQKSEPVNDEFGQRQNKPRRQVDLRKHFHVGLLPLGPLSSSLGSGVLWAAICFKNF